VEYEPPDTDPVGVGVDVGVDVDLARSDSDGSVLAGGETKGSDLDIELLEAIEQELADVELALERLGNGSYGSCETCGQVFSDDELEAAPAGRFCRAHLPLDLP
jgi:hypothetical protein